MPPDPQAYQRMMAEMNAEYRRALPEKLTHIEALWARLASGGWSAPACEELLRSAHTVAGSAKTFGLAAVSDAARSLEEALAPLGGTGVPASGDLGRIGALIEALRTAAMPPGGG